MRGGKKILDKIALLGFQRQRYNDFLRLGLFSNNEHCELLERNDNDDMETPEEELKWTLKQGPFFGEDIQDTAEAAEDAYVTEFYKSLRLSSEGQKASAMRPKKALPRSEFRLLVGDYLSAFKPATAETGADAWCLALRKWLRVDIVKCADTIPSSLETNELSYMFGVKDAALRNPRNGLFLNKVVKKGFDNGWIAPRRGHSTLTHRVEICSSE